MQYCSLQHRTLLLSPITSTTGYCFCFGSFPSFFPELDNYTVAKISLFLELFLHWSPVASGGDGIPVELFQILIDDAVKGLHSVCQQIWKTQQWPQDWKREWQNTSVFLPQEPREQYEKAK